MTPTHEHEKKAWALWAKIDAETTEREIIKILSQFIADKESSPISIVTHCPAGHLHIDKGDWAQKPHKTHRCQVIPSCLYPGCTKSHSHEICGLEWRPMDRPTFGIKV